MDQKPSLNQAFHIAAKSILDSSAGNPEAQKSAYELISSFRERLSAISDESSQSFVRNLNEASDAVLSDEKYQSLSGEVQDRIETFLKDIQFSLIFCELEWGDIELGDLAPKKETLKFEYETFLDKLFNLGLPAYLFLLALLLSVGIPVADLGNIYDFYPESVLSDEDDYIRSCQISSGAVLSHENSNRIVPYFANLALRGSVMQGDLETVRKYIDWYIRHINSNGTMNDYLECISGSDHCKTERSQKEGYGPVDPDSFDSYLATFLTLVREYYDRADDAGKEFIHKKSGALGQIVSSIDLVHSDEIGLTCTHEDGNYLLMDNIEVWRGYMDYIEFLKKVQAPNKSVQFYLKRADDLKKSIYKYFRNDDGTYKHHCGPLAYDKTTRCVEVNWNNFYTVGAMADLWPIVYDFPEKEEGDHEKIWSQFKESGHLEKWVDLKVDERDGGFPHVVVGVVALKMEGKKALPYVDRFLDRLTYPFGLDPVDRKPWSVNESYWLIHLGKLKEEVLNGH